MGKSSIATDTWAPIRSISASALNDDNTLKVSACFPAPQLCPQMMLRKEKEFYEMIVAVEGHMALKWVTKGPVLFTRLGSLKTWQDLTKA